MIRMIREKEERWKDKRLFMCGTCDYKRKGRCFNVNSKSCDELVDDNCSCDEYVPHRDIRL